MDDGPGTLREKITLANADTTPDIINFNIPGGGPETIVLQDNLPEITNTVTIDGTTQPRKPGEVDLARIVIDASGTFLAPTLMIRAGGSTIEGLALINNPFSSAIDVEQGADRVVIRSNFIGLNPITMLAAPNASGGISVEGSNATIGGTTPGARNVISGNMQDGISIVGSAGGPRPTGNVVIGNLIGTGDGLVDRSPATLTPIPNENDGISLQFADNNVIGQPGVGNLIASNLSNGIEIRNSAGNRVQGNGIGTTLGVVGSGIGLGPGIHGNGGAGVILVASSTTTIGGTADGAGNVVSGNQTFGVSVTGGSGNLLLGNKIGTDAFGVNSRPNVTGGVAFFATARNTIGGAGAGAANLISGNVGDGISIQAASRTAGATPSMANLILGNRIGTDRTGTAAVPNTRNGVTISDAPANSIGGTAAGAIAANLIAGNGGDGILIFGARASGNVVAGNLVGITAAGASLGNSGDGVKVDAPGNTIGGTTRGAGNTIGGNRGSGVVISPVDPLPPRLPLIPAPINVDGNAILSNTIGVGPGGFGAGNKADGVDFYAGSGEQIVSNLISGNVGIGVFLQDVTGGAVQGNSIGATPSGATGNRGDGLNIIRGSGIAIGGASGAGNLIAGNFQIGISILDSAGDTVRGNTIGGSTAGLGNGSDGLNVTHSPGVSIGGGGAGAGNLIASNGGAGIIIHRAVDDPVVGNTIGSGPIGSGGNGRDGIDIFDGSGVLILDNSVVGSGGIGVFLTELTGARIERNTIGSGPGGLAGNGRDGLDLIGGSDVAIVADLVVESGGRGVLLLSVTNARIQGDRIGVGPDGPAGNGRDGLVLDNVSGSAIGGSDVLSGNVISDNGGAGIIFLDSRDDLFRGNIVDANGKDGLILLSSPGVSIGGSGAGAGNTITGNLGAGVSIAQAEDNPILGNTIGGGNRGDGLDIYSGRGVQIISNFVAGNGGIGIFLQDVTGGAVQGNNIGVGPAGVSGNRGNGLDIIRGSGIAIGGASGAGNVIAGNLQIGISILDSANDPVLGNVIGGKAAGFGNGQDGLDVTDSPGVPIGGTAAGARNVIVGNGGAGIIIRGAVDDPVVGNTIGSGPIGSGGNGRDGVDIFGGSDVVVVDDSVVGNGGIGIFLQSVTGARIQGDTIGVGPGGPAGNALDGIHVNFGSGVLIGGTEAGAGNVIVDGGRSGVVLQGTTGDRVQGNSIGIIPGVPGDAGNGQDGVDVIDSSSILIGGTAAGARNVISGSTADGILIQDSAASPVRIGSGIQIQGNVIGLDATATLVAGNGRDGIRVVGAPNVVIGGPTPAAGNLISGNAVGLEIAGTPAGPMGLAVQGNIIGLGADGETVDGGRSSLRNSSDGILLALGTSGVTIGGATPGMGNVVSGNGGSGIHITTDSGGNRIEGNRIGTGIGGLSARGNNLSGVTIEGGSTGNTVGGTSAGAGNVIGSNATGITLSNAGTSGNRIEGNLIGLGVDGSTGLGNIAFGVLLIGGPTGNIIGGTAPGARDVISDNGQGVGIIGPGTSGNVIEGDYIGLDATGSLPRGNLQLGIFVDRSNANTIGGTSDGAGNVISANTGAGVVIFGPEASANLVAGNRIGTDATGTRGVDPSGNSLGNVNFGIQLNNAPANLIGGTTPGARNVISGNRQAGIQINGPSAGGNVVEGNYIGVDATGTVGLGNLADGIQVENAPGNILGGIGPSARNVISANRADGIEIAGAGAAFDEILANYIGTDATGSVALGNGQSGVLVTQAPGVTIGGTIPGLGNLISANGQDGVHITGAGSAGSIVAGNFIGTDATGRLPRGNENDGVFLDAAALVLVGGTAPGSPNLISASGSSGVELGTSSAFNQLAGNRIGTDVTGSAALANVIGVFVNNAPLNRIGGPNPGEGNLISGNTQSGVHIFGLGSAGNVVQGNRIGTDLAGLKSIANPAGVFIDAAPRNLIGGPAVGDGNLLSGNTADGVIIQGAAATGNIIQGNLIGPDASGAAAIGSAAGPVPQQQSGVLIVDAPGNVVGGTIPSAGDVISGNVAGVVITGFNARGNVVLGNRIGTDGSGRVAVGNATGVYINGSSSNIIGGTGPGSANTISGNTTTGITLFGPQTTGNRVLGNRIGTDATGTIALPNPTGVFIQMAPSNTIGGPTAAAGNLISGNAVAGVYLFDAAVNNLVQENRIGTGFGGGRLGNGQYGILLFNAANNNIDKSRATGNKVANSGIGDFREFTGSATTTSTTTTTRTPAKKPARRVAAIGAHPGGPVAPTSRPISRRA